MTESARSIGYIRKDIPSFSLPAYKGDRYTARIPDTLDLQERAALTLNALTAPTDALADYEILPGSSSSRTVQR